MLVVYIPSRKTASRGQAEADRGRSVRALFFGTFLPLLIQLFVSKRGKKNKKSHNLGLQKQPQNTKNIHVAEYYCVRSNYFYYYHYYY